MQNNSSSGQGGSSKINAFLSVRRNQVILFAVLAGAVVVLMGAMTLILLQMTNLVDLPMFAAAPTPTRIVPTPACVQPKLTVGAASFPIQPLKRGADGTITLPGGAPGTAYWVEGTTVNFVFSLSPAPAVGTLADFLKGGESIKITWADCTSEEFVVDGIMQGSPEPAALNDQSTSGVRVYLPAADGQVGMLIAGKRAVQPGAEATLEPPADDIQAQVEFLGTDVSADGKTLTVSIAITNQGSKAIQVAPGSLSLQAESQPAKSPVSVQPALPLQIEPGARLPLVIVFAKPDTSVAVFKVLNFSVDLSY